MNNKKSQSNTVKDGLPTAEEVLKTKVPPSLYERGDCYVGHALDAMQSYSDQQNAALHERVKELEKEVNDMTEFIPIYEGKIHKERCRADDAENRVNELEAAMNRIMEISITDTGRILSQSYGIAKEALKQEDTK